MTWHLDQYRAVRDRVGITVRSDIGIIRVTGEDSRPFLHGRLTGNIENLAENAVRHTLLLDPDGTLVADVHVYSEFDECFVTCEPAVRGAVVDRLRREPPPGVTVEDVSERFAAIAVDGPYAWRIPQQIVGVEAGGLRPMNFIRAQCNGEAIVLSRVGGSGEYGYLMIASRTSADDLLERVRRAAPDAPLCDPATHDLLRLEVRSFNHASDLPRGESPLEAGLHWMIHFRKPSFVGGEALRAELARGLAKKMIALRVAGDQAPPRLAWLFDGRREIGYVANAAVSPEAGTAIALAFVESAYAWVGLSVQVHTPDGVRDATTVSSPFVVTRSTRVPIA